MSCTDFCTAAKCAELEEKIDSLESQIITLKDALLSLKTNFETHISQNIPTAHKYEPAINIAPVFEDDNLYIDFTIDGVTSASQVRLPIPDLSDLELSINPTAILGEHSFVITAGGYQTQAIQIITYPEVELTLRGHYYGNSIELYLTGSGYTENVTEEVYLELDELTIETEETDSSDTEHVVSNLNVDLSYSGNYFVVTVSDGESSGSDRILLRSGGGGDGDSMSCEQTITDCCAALTALITNVSTQVDSVIAQNTEIKNELIIDVVGTTMSEYEPEFELDDDGDIIPTYAITKSRETIYENKGLNGIHDVLKLVLANQQTLHDFTVKSISPPVAVNMSNIVDNLCQKSGMPKQEDFDNEQDFLDRLIDSAKDLLSDSISKSLLKRLGAGTGPGGLVVTTTIDWGISYLIDKLTAREQISNQTICNTLNGLENYLGIDITGTTPTNFVCSDSKDECTVESTALTYEGKGFEGIHALLKTFNQNLETIFKAICCKHVEIAAPSWWQVRLGGNVPQICCTFRRVGTRNYHSLTIPHPVSTERPTEKLLSPYTKGNIQAMIVCTDNSKFIVNCNSVEEAERVANEAKSLIDPNYLPNPFKVWIGERKGEVVAEDLMQPTSIFYYSQGQKNSIPDWRIGLTNISNG